MGTNIFPTNTRYGTTLDLTQAPTDALYEQNLRAHQRITGASVARCFLFSGMALSGNPSDLDVNIAAGIAVVDGHILEFDAAVNGMISAYANDTSFIWLRLNYTGANWDEGQISGLTYHKSTAMYSVPTEGRSVLLGWVVADGTHVTSATAAQKHPLFLSGSYTGDETGSGTRVLPLEVSCRMVEIWGCHEHDTGSGDKKFSYSTSADDPSVSKGSGGKGISSNFAAGDIGATSWTSDDERRPYLDNTKNNRAILLENSVAAGVRTGLNCSGEEYFFKAWPRAE